MHRHFACDIINYRPVYLVVLRKLLQAKHFYRACTKIIRYDIMKESDTYCRICTTGIALTSNGLQNRCRSNNPVIEISENVYQNKGVYVYIL